MAEATTAFIISLRVECELLPHHSRNERLSRLQSAAERARSTFLQWLAMQLPAARVKWVAEGIMPFVSVIASADEIQAIQRGEAPFVESVTVEEKCVGQMLGD